MVRVSFQGERGAYSESAATSFFSDNIETLPCKTFADALKKTSDDLTEGPPAEISPGALEGAASMRRPVSSR